MNDPHLEIRDYYRNNNGRWYESPKEFPEKAKGCKDMENQKDALIEIMRGDEELGLYNEPASNKRVFESGSQRDNDVNKPLPNHLDAYVRMRYGYLLRNGATHYGKGNWKKGQPKETAIESLHRHLGWFEINHDLGLPQDEDHLSAMIFNIQIIMKNEQKDGIKVDQYYKPI